MKKKSKRVISFQKAKLERMTLEEQIDRLLEDRNKKIEKIEGGGKK